MKYRVKYHKLENQEGRGVLFQQRNVEGKQPTWRGGINIDGVEYEVAGWENKSKHGVPYISLSVQLARNGF